MQLREYMTADCEQIYRLIPRNRQKLKRLYFGGAIKEENISLDDFIDNADKSLYKAKQTGRNKSVI